MNLELVKLIEESQKNLKEDFNKILDEFLISIDGYSQLSEDGKVICRIFCCLNIIYQLQNLKEKSK